VKDHAKDMTDIPLNKKNPKWTRQETILALDLYLQAPGIKFREPEDPAVVELSKLLNQYHRSIGTPQTSDLRNPNGVSMKLGNFMRLDPEVEGSGLPNGARLEEEVWNTYAKEHDLLRREAALLIEHIRATSPSTNTTNLPDLESDEDLESEGDPRTYVHRSYERKSGNRKRKIDSIKKRGLPIVCECCGFDFEKTYGERGREFIEVHHAVPVSELGAAQKLRLSDLNLLCSNCHRMVHRRRPWLSVEEIQSLIGSMN